MMALCGVVTAQASEVLNMIAKYDADGSGGLSYNEFATAMQALELQPTARLREMWSQIDADGNGVITYEELQDALTVRTVQGRLSVPKAYAKGSASERDVLEEIQVSAFATNRSAADQLNMAFGEMAMDRVFDVFKAWDDDGGGNLSRGEFAQAMRELGMKSTKKEIYKLFNDLDHDNSGTVNYRELYWHVKDARATGPEVGYDKVARPAGSP